MPAVRSRGLVLLVEDDRRVAVAEEEVIRDAGFDVIRAETAVDALLILQHGDRVALLFTDVQLPGGMDGLELARRVSERLPDIPILITSASICPPEELLPEGSRFIAKPNRPMALMAEIDRLAPGRTFRRSGAARVEVGAGV